jgi:hypothetical protein
MSGLKPGPISEAKARERHNKYNGKRRSRFPEGMTERKARATAKATVTAREEADSQRE